MSDAKSQSATAASRPAIFISGVAKSVSAGCSSTMAPCPEKSVFALLPNVRNSSSSKSVSMSFTGGFHCSFGMVKETGASRRMVANILENTASSSPSDTNFTTRAFIPFFSNSSGLFFNVLYIFSTEPNARISSPAAFSPIPLMPGMLSDGSPRRPL